MSVSNYCWYQKIDSIRKNVYYKRPKQILFSNTSNQKSTKYIRKVKSDGSKARHKRWWVITIEGSECGKRHAIFTSSRSFSSKINTFQIIFIGIFSRNSSTIDGIIHAHWGREILGFTPYLNMRTSGSPPPNSNGLIHPNDFADPDFLSHTKTQETFQ